MALMKVTVLHQQLTLKLYMCSGIKIHKKIKKNNKQGKWYAFEPIVNDFNSKGHHMIVQTISYFQYLGEWIMWFHQHQYLALN